MTQDDIDTLVEAGRILERYENPKLRPLSEQNFRTMTKRGETSPAFATPTRKHP